MEGEKNEEEQATERREEEESRDKSHEKEEEEQERTNERTKEPSSRCIEPSLAKQSQSNLRFLSCCGGEFLRQLVEADLSHNKIVTISNKAFSSQVNLKHLRLESNKISQVNNLTFYGLRQLEVISLRGNIIESLPDDLFEYCPKLKEIDLSQNRIADIQPTAFKGLSALRILNLADNLLTSVPSAAFQSLPHLAELRLSGNPLTTIGESAFISFQSLSILDLSSTRLRSLKSVSLQGLGTLRHLDLADNNLSSIPSEALSQVSHLESLDLGRNPFQVVHPNALGHLRGLKKLALSGCGQLVQIASQAFRNCIDLEHVTISLNHRLASLADDAFDPAVPNLRFLNLAGNDLRALSETLVPWHQLRELDLSNNPWNCNCNMAFLPRILAHFQHHHLQQQQQQQLQRPQRQQQQPSLSVLAEAAEDNETQDPTARGRAIFRDGICAAPSMFKDTPLSRLETSVVRESLYCDTTLSSIGAAQPHGGGVMLMPDQSSPTTPHSSQNGAVAGGGTTVLSGTGLSKEDMFRRSNATAVIVSICVVSITLLLAVIILLVMRCRGEWPSWMPLCLGRRKEHPIKANHAIYIGTTNSHHHHHHQNHHDPYMRHHDYMQTPSYSCEDEHYYYVATMQNRMTAGKHIPVTEL
eukprot:TCALIF_05164-PA protein Name:"Similar to LRRN2 Leucine-rich repeat neuronal protein 2 (Homo sapiens)" AED:0.14 eAED:0.14 QI:0/0.33/0.5/0.75/0.66/0.75/4/1171/640